jgi:surface protein
MRKSTFLLLVGALLFTNFTSAQDFITKWRFTAATTQIDFVAGTAGVVNYTWTHGASSGSGSFDAGAFGGVTISGINLPANTELTLRIEPANFRRFFIRNSAGSRDGLRDISQWGAVPWSTMQVAFAGAPNLNISATDVPNLSNVTNMTEMFSGCSSLNGPANIGSWNTSTVTNMSLVFNRATAFNQPINGWNVSNVTSMSGMFYEATAFNQPLDTWNTGKVTDMTNLFYSAGSFNQPLNMWNTSSVTIMAYMFHQAFAFNQPIGNWNVSNVTNYSNMLVNATSFNQSLGDWVLNPNATGLSFFSTAVDCSNYSLTLKGWAENNPTVLNRSIGGNGRFYGPAAVPYRNQLISQGWTISGDTYDPGCNVVLPVLFGDITAVTKNNNLQVDWTTLSEHNNDHFEIEASADGAEFIAIGELKTQAKDGNAEGVLSYSFTKEASAATGLLGFTIATLVVSGFVAAGKRRKIGTWLMAGMVLLLAVACNKDNEPVKSEGNNELYVRIKQVDKDGVFKYSKVVKAVQR